MRITTAALLVVAAAFDMVQHYAVADIYMHNPRGSNNRNCGTGENRRNGDRLFDSENNAKGGYACPRAKPFDCYKHYDDDTARAECNAQETEIDTSVPGGALQSTNAIDTPRLYHYVGSVLPIGWTNQHGSGANPKLHSEVVIQVACEGTLTDDCGDENGGKTCGPRDGLPTNNNDEAVQRIGTSPEDQSNYNKGRHETLRYYQKCMNRERNRGLFTADQDINGNSAMYTRQDPNLDRQGLECKEEAQYWPYWHDSPWIDIAVVTSNMTKCMQDAGNSQNVQPRYECVCPECTGTGNLPNQRGECMRLGGDWVEVPAYNTMMPTLGAPECVPGAFSRANHLGNVGGDGQPYTYNWTIPDWLEGNKTCVLRVRYNVSTADADSVSVFGDVTNSGEASPIFDRDEREELSYVQVADLGLPEAAKLGLAVQSNQVGRTFQDRSYLFEVKPVPEDAECNRIFNLNARGKRGNIVQAYPAVEYDFAPSHLHISEDDCVHAQWTGSDYNPNRNPNNGEGGPPDPTNLNAGRSDRHNMVPMHDMRENGPLKSAAEDAAGVLLVAADGSRDVRDTTKRLMFIDQPIEDATKCMSVAAISEALDNANKNNGRDDRERSHMNCGKLSGAKTPYFDGGLLRPTKQGTYKYMSTRNNNFTNRSQKGVIVVGSGAPATSTVAGGLLGGIAVIGVAGFAAMKLTHHRSGRPANVVASKESASTKGAAGPVASSDAGARSAVAVVCSEASYSVAASVVTAMYDREAAEEGELAFKAGDKITVLSTDPSGWWTGKIGAAGPSGVFPSNFVSGTDTTRV